MTGARSTDRFESQCLVVLLRTTKHGDAASCSLKLACEPALVSAFWIYIYTGKCLKPSVYLMATSIFQIYEITACSSLLLTWCMSLYVCVYVTDTENNVHINWSVTSGNPQFRHDSAESSRMGQYAQHHRLKHQKICLDNYFPVTAWFIYY